jgi:hypothetical protein
MVQVDVGQLFLLEINFFAERLNYELEEASQMVWVVDEYLEQLFNFDCLLPHTVAQL